MTEPVIVGLGAQTPVGLTWPATAAAVRAGLNVFTMSEHLRGRKDGRPLTVSRLSTLANATRPYERMKALAAAAATEALAPWQQRLGDHAPLLLLSLPGDRPGFSKADSRQLAQEIVGSLPVPVDMARSHLVSTGAEGGLAALAMAADAVVKGAASAALVGGVESYIDIHVLDWMDQHDRLAGPDQPNGLVPGEGAGFVLVCSDDVARERKLPILGRVLSAGRGHEPRPWWRPDPSTGAGLTQAFQAAFEAPGAPSDQVRVTYSDLNGETWRAEEWSYAYVRTGQRHASPLDLRHPATSWGDVGAATGPLLAGLAALDLATHFEPHATALLWAASDIRPFRSACLLRGPLIGSHGLSSSLAVNP
jgi:3-oxoacyl-[acyl-carrier-protein] synthase-1